MTEPLTMGWHKYAVRAVQLETCAAPTSVH